MDSGKKGVLSNKRGAGAPVAAIRKSASVRKTSNWRVRLVAVAPDVA